MSDVRDDDEYDHDKSLDLTRNYILLPVECYSHYAVFRIHRPDCRNPDKETQEEKRKERKAHL